ncbi:protein FAM200A-like [Pseudorasbora parva]|uniref:protein FAM200A-like n=1 Tax=Pseudorasbora parva TaxID=51549 RepID=UPI00351EC310
MPPKSGKWSKYGKKYSKEWEREDGIKEWIQRVTGDDTKAFCKYCKAEIRAHHSDLLHHSKTEKHVRNAAPFSSVRMRTLFDSGITAVKIDQTVKVTELKLAAHIACHSSILTVDHLGELVGEIAQRDIRLHRTKCSALIKQVIGPEIQWELLKDIGEELYSLIIDESTDMGMHKQFAVVVRYCSTNLQRIVSSFAGIVHLDGGDAASLTEALLNFLQENKLCPKRCIGLATDGCNAMCGQHNSVVTKFRQHNPNFVFVKCACHSIQLCSSYAMRVLPRNVEYQISQTYAWFSHSTIRQQNYQQLYAAINVGEAPLKILQLSDTRWLSVSACLNRVLAQYDELKLHFQLAKDKDRNYNAEILYQMYSDPVNKLYLVFLQPIVQEANRVNKMFQLENANPCKLFNELITFYLNLLRRVAKINLADMTQWSEIIDFDVATESAHLPLSAVDYGLQFQIELDNVKLPISDAENIKHRCKEYLLEFVKQIKKRLTTNMQQLQSLVSLSPSVVLNSQKKPQLASMSFLCLYTGDLAKLDQQWRVLDTLAWEYTEDCQLEKFWIDVKNHRDAAGDQDFYELGSFALSLLALPFSNAAVERTFSEMNLIKTKLRSRMKDTLLENILRIRAFMQRHGICCHQFEPTKEMLALFNTNMYDKEQEGEE